MSGNGVLWYYSPDGYAYPVTRLENVDLDRWNPLTDVPPGGGTPPVQTDVAPSIVSNIVNDPSSTKVSTSFTTDKPAHRRMEYSVDGGNSWTLDPEDAVSASGTAPSPDGAATVNHSFNWPAGTSTLPENTEVNFKIHLRDPNNGLSRIYPTSGSFTVTTTQGETPPPPPPVDAPRILDSPPISITPAESYVTTSFNTNRAVTRETRYSTDGGVNWVTDSYVSPLVTDHTAIWPAARNLPANTTVLFRFFFTDADGMNALSEVYTTKTLGVAPPTSNTGNFLKYRPPVLNNPIVWSPTASSRSLNAGDRDVLLENVFVTWDGGLELTTSGNIIIRNVVFKYEREFFNTSLLNGSSDPGTNRNRCMRINGNSNSRRRVLFIDGLLTLKGDDGLGHVWEGINIIDASTRTHYYAQNIRQEAGIRVHYPSGGSGHYGGDHEQWWNGPTRMYRYLNTFIDTHYQGFMMQARKFGNSYPDASFEWEKIDFLPRQQGGMEQGLPSSVTRSQSAHAYIFYRTDENHGINLRDVYVKPSPERGSRYIAIDGTSGNAQYPSFMGAVINGTPPNGHFVPRTLWGSDLRSYVTPGYVSGAAVAT